jgi:hypothetical protein
MQTEIDLSVGGNFNADRENWYIMSNFYSSDTTGDYTYYACAEYHVRVTPAVGGVDNQMSWTNVFRQISGGGSPDPTGQILIHSAEVEVTEMPDWKQSIQDHLPEFKNSNDITVPFLAAE